MKGDEAALQDSAARGFYLRCASKAKISHMLNFYSREIHLTVSPRLFALSSANKNNVLNRVWRQRHPGGSHSSASAAAESM